MGRDFMPPTEQPDMETPQCDPANQGENRMETRVKVRIAVAVDKLGNWVANGWTDSEWDEAMAMMMDDLEPGERRFWVEAYLPLPVEEVTSDVVVTDVTAEGGE